MDPPPPRSPICSNRPGQIGVKSVKGVGGGSNVSSVSSYGAVLPPSVMVFSFLKPLLGI